MSMIPVTAGCGGGRETTLPDCIGSVQIFAIGGGSFVVIRGSKERKDSIVSVLSFSQEKIENPGLLQSFLLWIARGTEKSHIGGRACPT